MSVRSFTLCTSSMCVLAYPVLAEFDGKAKVSKYSNLKDLMRVDISFHPLCSVFCLTKTQPQGVEHPCLCAGGGEQEEQKVCGVPRGVTRNWKVLRGDRSS